MASEPNTNMPDVIVKTIEQQVLNVTKSKSQRRKDRTLVLIDKFNHILTEEYTDKELKSMGIQVSNIKGMPCAYYQEPMFDGNMQIIVITPTITHIWFQAEGNKYLKDVLYNLNVESHVHCVTSARILNTKNKTFLNKIIKNMTMDSEYV